MLPAIRDAGHRRTRTIALATALVMLVSLAPALGHGVIDQTHEGDDGTTPCSAAEYPGSALVVSDESRQSFVPTRGGIASVEVCIQDLIGVAGTDLIVRLYEGGTATAPGPEIGAVPVDVGSRLLTAQWLHVDFPIEVATTPGATYVVGLTPTSTVAATVSFRWRATCSEGLLTTCQGTPDAYPQGNTNDLPANADYAFRTFPLHAADLSGTVEVDRVVCPGLDLAGRASGAVTNDGATAVGAFATEWRLSPDATLDATDLVMPGSRHEVPGLAAGSTHLVPPPTQMPDADEVAEGDWHLLLQVDPDGDVLAGGPGVVAAAPTVVTGCGQPDITELGLAVADDTVPTGFRAVQAADLPLRDLALGLPQTFAEAEANLEAAPYGFSPVGFSPVGFSPYGFSPVGFSPVGFSPYGFSPYGFSPVGFSPVGFSPVGFSSLSEVLDDLPAVLLERMLVVDIPIVGAGWEARLSGLIGDRPIQDVTLAEAAALLPDLTLQDVDTRAVLRASWLSLALANGTLDDLPLPDGTTWCEWMAAAGIDCTAVGIDPATDSLLAAEAAGVPVRALPVADASLADTGVNPAWLVNSLPLTGSPRAHLELTRLGGLAADVALTDPATVIDCEAFDCSRPLAEAVAADAVRDVNVAVLLDGLTPAGLVQATLTDLALLVADLASLDLGDMLWTLADPYEVDPSCPTMTYSLTGTNSGEAAAVDPTASITLAPGFGYVPGSATLSHDGGAAAPQAEPAVTRDDEGRRTLTFTTDAIVASTFHLSFSACASLYLGNHEAGEARVTGVGIHGPFSGATDPAAIDLIHVVEQSEEDGPADTPDSAQEIGPNAVVAVHLQSADDTDHLRIAVPDEPDSLTIVRVFPPPTVDADATVHGPAVSPFGFSPVGFSPVGFSPVGFSPYGFSPYGFSPYGFSNDGAPVNGSDDASEPDTLNDVPTHLAPSDTSGLRAVSAHRGDQVETIHLRNRDGDDGFFTIGISGYNGASANAPVIVTVQQIAPTPNPALTDCAPAPWDLTTPSTATAPAYDGTEPPRSVFVVNRQASASLYGESETVAGLDALDQLAARPEIRGIVLEVDHDPAVRQAYADWRADWCSPTAANDVASRIRGQVLELREQYPSIDTIVLAGGDEIVPDFRLADASLLANEAQYTESLLNAYGSNNPTVAAYANGTIPSIDPYGTERPSVWGESFAFLPSAGVSRLVETPADWIVQKDQYLISDGTLDPADGFVSGYDGMADGAQAAAAAMQQAGVPTTVLVDDAGPWSAEDFRASAIAATPDLAGWNAHANHWALLSSLGSAQGDESQAEIVTSAEQDDLGLGGLIFSNGCHFGAQAPNSLNGAPTPDQAERLDDWDAAIASRGGIAVANSGFGIFETEIVGYGEQLQTLFVEELATAPNAALALARAKTRYLTSLAVHDPYQYKTVQQLSLFGLGTFRMTAASGGGEDPTPPADTDAIPVTTGDLAFDAITTADGTHYDVVGHPTATDTTPLAINARPVVPKLTLAVPLPDGRASAGVWINDLTSAQVDDIDPLIARAAVSRPDREVETQTRSVIFPTVPASAVDADGAAHVTFPVGAFTTQDAANAVARGTLRLDTRIDADLLLRDAGIPASTPHIAAVNAVRSEDGNLVVVDVVAHEIGAPNIRAAALARDDLGEWTYRELHLDPDGHWTSAFALTGGATEVVELLIQVSNGRGVGYWRNKGEAPRLRVASLDGVDLVLASAAGQHSSGIWLGPVDATIVGVNGVTYRVHDRSEFVGDLANGDTFVVTGDGDHELHVAGSDGSHVLEAFTIDGTAPTITLASPPVGASFEAGATATVEFSCEDAVTGATCSATVDGTPIASGDPLPTSTIGTHTVVVTGVDGVGNSSELTRDYVVESRWTMGEFESPIQSMPRVNTKTPGSNVAIKFQVWDTAGNEVFDLAVIDTVTWTPMTCSSKVTTGDPVVATGTAPTRHAGHFHIDVDAPTTSGCFLLTVSLDDGTTQSAWFRGT